MSAAKEKHPGFPGSFREDVYAVVRAIPAGRVASYGTVAALAGYPGAARAVGNALHVNPYPDLIPCFRVVNAGGRLSGAFAFGGPFRQKELLTADGVKVENLRVNMVQYAWYGTESAKK